MRRLFTRGKRRGQSIIEFALILPLFLILTGGVVDYGVYMFQREQAASCVRTVARMIVVRSPAAPTGANSATWSTLAPQCAKAVQQGGTAFVAPGVNSSSPVGGSEIEVKVNYSYAPIFLSRAIPGLTRITIMPVTATIKMRMEAGSI